jgi:hypothetical protein
LDRFQKLPEKRYSFGMFRNTPKTRTVKRLFSRMLVIAILLPAGLSAKSAMEFCMMSMHDHHGMEMSGDMHDCCNSEASDNDPCPEISYCTCSFEDTGETEPFRVQQSPVKLALVSNPFLEPPVLPDDRIDRHQEKATNEPRAPLYLLYDTFLI